MYVVAIALYVLGMLPSLIGFSSAYTNKLSLGLSVIFWPIAVLLSIILALVSYVIYYFDVRKSN